MSTYGFDPQSRALAVAWPTGRAGRVKTLSVLPSQVPVDRIDRLLMALDGLSEALWDTYTHPAWLFGDPETQGTAAWRWRQEREAFDGVHVAVREPVEPDLELTELSRSRVEGSGRRIARALHDLDLGAEFGVLIADEVADEVAAVAAAEAGDLTGRAAQAVLLSRIGASPTQIEVAWQALLADPLRCREPLLSDFDPGAAAIATARCLRLAVRLAADVSGLDAGDVLAEANDIHPLPTRAPSTMLDLLDGGATEQLAVSALLLEARAVSEGTLTGVDHVLGVLERVRLDEEAGVEEIELRLTPLDPRRPAPDLLEDLLTAIDGCYLLWRESADIDDESAAGGPDGDDADDWYARAARQFSAELRQAMQAAGSPT